MSMLRTLLAASLLTLPWQAGAVLMHRRLESVDPQTVLERIEQATRNFDPTAPHDQFRCEGFYTVVETAWEPKESCKWVFPKLAESFAVLSAQMVEYNTTLTVYATRKEEEKADAACQLNFPNIEVIDFKPGALLREAGFTEDQTEQIHYWNNADKLFTRRSDLFRITLGIKTRKSYLDTDILLLSPKPDIYLREYVSTCVWGKEGASLEISNSAFCLPPWRLIPIMDQALKVVAEKGQEQKYFYTELGPAVFQSVLLNADEPIRLMSQNHPLHHDLDTIAAEYGQQKHMQMHLTGKIRRENREKGIGYVELVQKIRKVAGLQPLNVSVPDDMMQAIQKIKLFMR